MQNVRIIYQNAVKPLPDSEKLRLAALILQDLSGENDARENLSALDLLESLPAEKVFESSREVDEYLKAERESWHD